MDAAAQIAQAKETTLKSSADLLNTFSFVPEERLTFAPSETSRHALWIVGHCARANQAFARGIRGEDLGGAMSPEDFGKMVWNAGKDTLSREEAIELVKSTTEEVVAALDALSPEQLGGTLQTPFGPMPMAFWITISGPHMGGHARQIDYLQTIWGDLDNHMMAA